MPTATTITDLIILLCLYYVVAFYMVESDETISEGLLSHHHDDSSNASPVILIPGLGGNQVEAKLNRSETVSKVCYKQSDWFTIWVSLAELTYPAIECFADNLRLIYDPVTKTTRDNEGVSVRIPGFGYTNTVDYLDYWHTPLSSYFSSITNALLATKKYQQGVNIHGAPYDFRKGPSELQDYFKNLTNLVELTYQSNGNQPVVLIAHSMGCPLTLVWLLNKDIRWRHKYIRLFVPIAGVWDGSLKAVRLLISGDNINLFVVNPLHLRPIQRSSPSSLFLLPSNNEWAKDDIIAQTSFKNFTVHDYPELFDALNISFAKEIWMKEKMNYDPYKAPEIPVLAFYGTDVPTPGKLIYKQTGSNWMDYQPTIMYEKSGDGTVNERSLAALKKWKQKENLTVVTIPKGEHLVIMHNHQVVNSIVAAILDT